MADSTSTTSTQGGPLPTLPTEFFSTRSLYTLAGSAGAVWLCCAVISSVVAKDFFTPQQWRLIALFLSELLTFSFFFTRSRRHRTYQAGVLAMLNGCLVFVNASGINAVTSGLNFQTPAAPTAVKASLFPFTHEIDWWPSPELLAQRKQLEIQNAQLRVVAYACQQQLSTLKAGPPAASVPLPPTIPQKPLSLKRVARVARQLVAASAAAPVATRAAHTWQTTALAAARYVKLVEAVGSGCTYRITLDSLNATFTGRDSTLQSIVRFALQERSLSCHIPPYSVPSSRQQFMLAENKLDPHGRIHASYVDMSENPGFYRVVVDGQLVEKTFRGYLVVERPVHVGQPFFRQTIALHFNTQP